MNALRKFQVFVGTCVLQSKHLHEILKPSVKIEPRKVVRDSRVIYALAEALHNPNRQFE